MGFIARQDMVYRVRVCGDEEVRVVGLFMCIEHLMGCRGARLAVRILFEKRLIMWWEILHDLVIGSKNLLK